MARQIDYKDDQNYIKPKCTCCGTVYTRQQDKFFKNNASRWYKNNNGFLHVCKDCIINEYNKLKDELNSNEDAMKIICMAFDLYYDEDLFEASKKESVGRKSFCSSYFGRKNLSQVSSKTNVDKFKDEKLNKLTSINQGEENDIKEDSLKFWGLNYTPEEYQMLDDEYASWVIRHNQGDKPSKSLESFLKQACLMLVDIQRERKNGGKNVATLVKGYSDLMQSAGLKPIQEDTTSIAERNSLGNLIEKWETTQPVPDIAEEFKDVDKIKHYIDVFFKGHLSRMFGLKNETKEIYKEEMDKFTLKPPNQEDGEEVE